MLKLIPVAASTLLLAACGGISRQMNEPRDPERSLVYGYVDVKDGPCDMDEFAMRQVLPKVEDGGYFFRVDDGAFYAEYISPGSYQMGLLRGWGWFPGGNVRHTLGFPQQAEGLRIDRPGLYFVGSFKIKDLGKRKFDVEVCEKPTEREILEKILPHAGGTVWESRVRQRMDELK
jgi:hypothetical protein